MNYDFILKTEGYISAYNILITPFWNKTETEITLLNFKKVDDKVRVPKHCFCLFSQENVDHQCYLPISIKQQVNVYANVDMAHAKYSGLSPYTGTANEYSQW